MADVPPEPIMRIAMGFMAAKHTSLRRVRSGYSRALLMGRQLLRRKRTSGWRKPAGSSSNGNLWLGHPA